MLVAVYVDDLIIACSSKAELNDIKQNLTNEFDLVDKGPIKLFLGIEVERQSEVGDISLGHRKYIENLLYAYGMENCRQRSTPLDAGYQVIKDDTKTKVNSTAYQSLIGALMYLAVTTRPEKKTNDSGAKFN